VSLQAGNLNTGAFDPVAAVCERVRPAGAWVHVDGAFGLWARAAPSLAPLAAGGCEVLNEVVLNQVLVAFGDAARTRRVIEAVQADGTCWCGVTEWQGRTAMRISVSSWATHAEDVEHSVTAILRAAAAA
jgi:glutamate/tyrosine decarboxylase-like PLP-dependent enzyme